MRLKELDLHITNKCNMLCKHCVFSSGKRQIAEMNFNEIADLIKKFAEITFNKGIINLFGGEALLRADIFKIIKEAKNYNLSVGITTNCNVPKKIILKLLDQEINRITTNLDGATPRTHDWLRNTEGNFNKVIETLKLFVDKNVFTTINSVLYKDNIHEVIPLLELCEKLRVSALAFYFLTPTGRGLNIIDKVIKPSKWLETKAEAINWIEKHSPKFGITWEQAYEPVDHSKKVSLPWRCEKDHRETLFIRCDGEVYSCALLESAPCNLGNIKKDSLKDILNNRSKNAFTRERGCPALAFHVNKDLQSADPRISTNLIKLGCPYEYKILNKAAK